MTLNVLNISAHRLCGLCRHLILCCNSHTFNTHTNGGVSKFYTPICTKRSKTTANTHHETHILTYAKPIGRRYSSEDKEFRKRRVLFRAMNTGMKELDLILAEFIESHPDLIESCLNEFESFLELETCSLYDIIMGKTNYDRENKIVEHIKSFVTDKYK